MNFNHKIFFAIIGRRLTERPTQQIIGLTMVDMNEEGKNTQDYESRIMMFRSTRHNIDHVDGVQFFLGLHDDTRPTIYAVTPTHKCFSQKAELTRLCQTFLLVPNFHWIVVEDSSRKTDLVSNLLSYCGLRYTHLNIETPSEYRVADSEPYDLKPRGVFQRNLALKWLRENLDYNKSNGVIYFADMDNTYSLQVFTEVGYVYMKNTPGSFKFLGRG